MTPQHHTEPLHDNATTAREWWDENEAIAHVGEWVVDEAAADDWPDTIKIRLLAAAVMKDLGGLMEDGALCVLEPSDLSPGLLAELLPLYVESASAALTFDHWMSTIGQPS